MADRRVTVDWMAEAVMEGLLEYAECMGDNVDQVVFDGVYTVVGVSADGELYRSWGVYCCGGGGRSRGF